MFVELTLRHRGNRALVNTNTIESVIEETDGTCKVVITTEGSNQPITVKETYDEIKKAVLSGGNV